MIFLLLIFCILVLIVGTTRYKVHPFLALIGVAILFGLLSGMSVDHLLGAIKEGFGTTLGGIGLVIVFGVIIGAFLEHSGGAFTLARVVLRLVGVRQLPIGMGLIGFVVSIPVFCDSAFVLLSPLNKALTQRAKMSLAITVIALSMGLLASHSLVPPTPGPIAAAGIIGAEIGLLILSGVGVGLLALIAPITYGYAISRRIQLDPNPDFSDELIEEKMAQGPAAWKALLPIMVPIFLILVQSLHSYQGILGDGRLAGIFVFVGHPVIALMVGMMFSFLLPAKWEASMLSDQGWVGKALRDAAVILMITGAGGIFGKVLQESSLPGFISQHLGSMHIGIMLPFIIAAALKTAQGSSTVAIITTASIVAPLMASIGPDTEMARVLIVLAIGAGSAVISHAPDSYFWVVTQLSHMDVSQGYRIHAVASGLLGGSAMLIIAILWWMLVLS